MTYSVFGGTLSLTQSINCIVLGIVVVAFVVVVVVVIKWI